MVGVVVWLSLTPAPPKVDFEQSDKVGHLLAYGVLMFWFAQLYTRRTRFFYGLGFVAMGIVLEYLQDALGHRTLDVADMAANTLGVLAGWGGARIVRRALPGADHTIPDP
jgi:glycopeptide antibiotics resistance protein